MFCHTRTHTHTLLCSTGVHYIWNPDAATGSGAALMSDVLVPPPHRYFQSRPLGEFQLATWSVLVSLSAPGALCLLWVENSCHRQTCHISKRSWKHHNSDTDQGHVVCHGESSSARAWCVFTARRWDVVAKEDSTWNIDLLVDFERKGLRAMK